MKKRTKRKIKTKKLPRIRKLSYKNKKHNHGSDIYIVCVCMLVITSINTKCSKKRKN